MAIITSKRLIEKYSRARCSRDSRFDGVFFTAVKTTKIYCRSICPATPPLEKNVEYHDTAISAANAGFRPCLRCRPDSAPDSNPWRGAETTFQRALDLIQAGHLHKGTIESLADRLGISSRYLRKLFKQHIGASPKYFSIYQQCLFAKRLLTETNLNITEIAFASGFSSIRQFNHAIRQQLKLSPTQIRRKKYQTEHSQTELLCFELAYRPPYAWKQMISFLEKRLIAGLEWIENQQYGRTFHLGTAWGYFTIEPIKNKHALKLSVSTNELSNLFQLVRHIQALFDTHAPIHEIDQHLQSLYPDLDYTQGLRLPRIWNNFEAGIRAILGQQVSVKQALQLTTKLVTELGETSKSTHPSAKIFFPEPTAVLASDLIFLRMPQSRRNTLRHFAQFIVDNPDCDDIDQWLNIKGIGSWTINYVKLRASKNPDIWLMGDAGIKNALRGLPKSIDTTRASPWRSYLVFHLWNQLS